ncbi:MAG: hypothetical protein AB7U61_04575 [Methylocystis sp.]
MIISVDQAARLGGSAGVLDEAEPAGFASWPGRAQAAYVEAYAKGRHCRLVAEGKRVITAGEPLIHGGSTRVQLISQYNTSEAVRREFPSLEVFLAYARAVEFGSAKRVVGRVVSR